MKRYRVRLLNTLIYSKLATFVTTLCQFPHSLFTDSQTFCRRPPDRCAEVRIWGKNGHFSGREKTAERREKRCGNTHQQAAGCQCQPDGFSQSAAAPASTATRSRSEVQPPVINIELLRIETTPGTSDAPRSLLYRFNAKMRCSAQQPGCRRQKVSACGKLRWRYLHIGQN